MSEIDGYAKWGLGSARMGLYNFSLNWYPLSVFYKTTGLSPCAGPRSAYYWRPVAHVAELVDVHDSESCGATRGGSSPLVSTIFLSDAGR